jgi:hypothetical protein
MLRVLKDLGAESHAMSFCNACKNNQVFRLKVVLGTMHVEPKLNTLQESRAPSGGN